MITVMWRLLSIQVETTLGLIINVGEKGMLDVIAWLIFSTVVAFASFYAGKYVGRRRHWVYEKREGKYSW